MSQKYADIIIDISHEAIDKTFQYIIPEALEEDVEVGMQVQVPFGQSSKNRKGYVISITDKPVFDVKRMKEINGIPNKSLQLEGRMIKLAEWMRQHYGSTMFSALKTVMPVREKVRLTAPKKEMPEYELDKPPVLKLNEQQQALADEFGADISGGITKTYLLKGITGSGKTEVYIECIKKVIEEGKQAIVLIPEISMTFQNVARFRQHFGSRVAIINSQLSKGEKYREFERARKHEADVIIGARSALFTPCDKLGLIVIDEEHDGAYKSDMSPRYHARETAIKRAELENASVILGSATPSVESYMLAKLGTYRLWTLDSRTKNSELARTSIVDMREELHMGNRSIVSAELKASIRECLDKKEQIMLFINRRGYNSMISCRECGEVVKCPRCDVSLSYHSNGFMMCHYCGYIERKPKQCPKCHSSMIGGFGTGTEKVEAEIKSLFPDAATLRMDRDTTAKKGDHGRILSDFLKHKADILIGTQMIVKGHDFGNVTLVGIMMADISLFANDYRAGERTFELITQAAGRAGRGDKAGRVVIQTYQPEHYAIKAAAKQSYDEFFEMEISYRRLMKYPPVYNMMVILMTSEDKDKLDSFAEALAGKKGIAGMDGAYRLIGPADATISRINNLYRKVIYIKSRDIKLISEISDFVSDFHNSFLETEGSKAVNLMIDVNPMNMY